MAQGVLVPVADYLKTAYRPDCDYVDGEVPQRNLGEFEHSTAQREIILFLAAQFPALRKRLQARATRAGREEPLPYPRYLRSV